MQRVARKQFKDDATAQEKFIGDTIGRIKGSEDLKGTVKLTDLVIEAIVENIKIKQNLFATIDEAIILFIFSFCKVVPENINIGVYYLN